MKTKPLEIILTYGVEHSMVDFGSSGSAMVLVKVKLWNLGGEEDSFIRFSNVFLLNSAKHKSI